MSHACRPILLAIAALLVPVAARGPSIASAQTLADLVRAAVPAPVTEQEWIEADVLRGVAALAHYARTGRLPEASDVAVMLAQEHQRPAGVLDERRVTIAGRALQARLRVVEHVWAPSSYAAVARELLGPTEGLAAADGSGDAGLVLALLEPRVGVLLEWNEHVSAALARSPRSPARHEQAALLTAMLAMREGAGVFSDPRRLYGRVVAHLAIAQALRGTARPTRAGALAEIVLDVGAGRERDAVVKLAAIASRSASRPEQAWVRALGLRANEDWRVLPQPASATLLERLAHARAVRARLGDAGLLDVLDGVETASLVDWSRIALHEGFGVEAGRRFVQDAEALELREIRDVWRRLVRPGAVARPLIESLNDQPAVSAIPLSAPGARVQVLDWGSWAQAAARHLCARTADRSFHLRSQLGSDTLADRLDASARRAFGSLALFPLVRALGPVDASDYRRAMDAVQVLVRTKPEAITAGAWGRLRRARTVGVAASTLPPEFTWFRPSLPAGTLFEADERLFAPGGTSRPAATEVAAYRGLAPSHYRLAWEDAWHRYRGRPAPAEAEAAFQPFVAYDASALLALDGLLRAYPAERRHAARRLCEIARDRCDVLGQVLLDAGRDDEAANVFQRWADEARSAVRVANGIRWLVHYYLDKGRREQALATAARAAETLASEGLGTMAEALERTGRREEARTYCRKGWDRYDTGAIALVACGLRLSLDAGADAQAAKVRRWMARMFPQGLEKWAMPDTADPPDEGVRVTELGGRAASLGLHRDDVIVGVDGYRVASSAQYAVITRLRLEAGMRALVWRDGRYELLDLAAPQRWLHASFTDYESARGRRAALR